MSGRKQRDRNLIQSNAARLRSNSCLRPKYVLIATILVNLSSRVEMNGSNFTAAPRMEPGGLNIWALILGLGAVILMIIAVVIYVVEACRKRKDEPLTSCSKCVFVVLCTLVVTVVALTVAGNVLIAQPNVLTLISGFNSTVDSVRSSIEESIIKEDTFGSGIEDTTGLNIEFITELSDAAIFGWVLLSIGTSVSITVLVIYIVKAACSKIKKFVKGLPPTMPRLINFSGRERKNINIPLEVGIKYNQFGILLLDDPNGARVANMEFKHTRDAEQINIQILSEWIAKTGKMPVKWSTLTEVLRDIELNTLASEIEEVKL